MIEVTDAAVEACVNLLHPYPFVSERTARHAVRSVLETALPHMSVPRGEPVKPFGYVYRDLDDSSWYFTLSEARAHAHVVDMGGGDVRALYEAAPRGEPVVWQVTDAAVEAAVSMFEALNDAGLYRDQWRSVLEAALPHMSAPRENELDQTKFWTFGYRNYRGETGPRQAVPLSVRYGSTEWHPEPQWLLRAFDIAKQAEREFAMDDISVEPTGYEPAPRVWNHDMDAAPFGVPLWVATIQGKGVWPCTRKSCDVYANSETLIPYPPNSFRAWMLREPTPEPPRVEEAGR